MQNNREKLLIFQNVAKALNEADVNWGVGASLLLYFNGIVETFNDADLLIDLKDINKVEDVFNTLGFAKELTINAHFQSDYFKTFVVDEMEFDVIGGFGIFNQGLKHFPFTKPFTYYALNGTKIPLDNLGNWVTYYNLMGRELKAKMIIDHCNKLIDNCLMPLSKDNIKAYQRRVIPNLGETKLFGVSLPDLRKLAKKIANIDYKTFFKINNLDCFEKVLLQGMVIGYCNVDFETKLKLIDDYLPLIDNWETCDTFVATLKFNQQDLQKFYPLLKKYAQQQNPYAIRMMIVYMLNYYNEDNYHRDIIATILKIQNEDYYVKMAIAWLLSEIYLKNPELVLNLLKTHALDLFIHNKTIQKICESLRAEQAEKQNLKLLKRK